MIQWKDHKMLNYNFLNNHRYWGEGLDKINHELPWKHEDFRKSLNPNTMDAAIWLVEYYNFEFMVRISSATVTLRKFKCQED